MGQGRFSRFYGLGRWLGLALALCRAAVCAGARLEDAHP